MPPERYIIRQAAEFDLPSLAAIIADSLMWERYGRSSEEASVVAERIPARQ